MRSLVAHAAFTLFASSSCILVLDFEDGGPQGTAGATEGGADTGGRGGGGADTGGGGDGGGGAPPGDEWVTALSSTPFGNFHTVDNRVSVKSIVVAGDTTWIGGYFFGEELKLRDDDGTEDTILTSATGVMTFVLALDADGKLIRAIPLASSAEPSESPFDEWLGTQLDVDDSGNVYVLTSHRGGVTLLDGTDAVASSLHSWDLLMMKLTSEGDVEWASNCAGERELGPDDVLGASLSARFAGVLVLSNDQIAFGTTVESSTNFNCTMMAGADVCDLPAQQDQSGLIATVTPDGRCDGGALQVQSHLPGAGGAPIPLWLDGMALDSKGEVLFSGRIAQGGGILEPWGATATPGILLAFTGSFPLDGGPPAAPPRFFDSYLRQFKPATDNVVGGSVANKFEDPKQETFTTSDVFISRGPDEDLRLGDPEDPKRSEIVETVSSRDGFVLIGGTLSEDSRLKRDLCGEGCDGDLQESDAACSFGSNRDGFWLLLDAANNAVGRSFGDCLLQTVVGSHLGAEAITLAIQVEGDMTLDLLSGEPRKIEAAEDQRLTLIAHLPRPAAAAR